MESLREGGLWKYRFILHKVHTAPDILDNLDILLPWVSKGSLISIPFPIFVFLRIFIFRDCGRL